jgi:hypothetical protein
MIHVGAIHSDLEQVRSEAIALADCLDGIGSPGRGPMEQDAIRGLSLFAWHIARDIEAVEREIEGGGEA